MTEVRCWEFASGELGGQGGRSEFIIGRLANWFVMRGAEDDIATCDGVVGKNLLKACCAMRSKRS